MATNEAIACEIVRRVIEKRRGEPLAISGTPDKTIRNAKAVEYTWDGSTTRYAVAHTRIESFPGQLFDDSLFKTVFEPLETALKGKVPGRFMLSVGSSQLTSPSPVSGLRYVAGGWSGAMRGWGYDNKETAVCVPLAGPGRVTNIELKTLDSTCNHYLALGAVILAGLDTASRGGRCWAIRAVTCAHQTRRRPIVWDLDVQLGRLQADETIAPAMGPRLVETYAAVRRETMARSRAMSIDRQIAVLIDRY